MTGVQGMETKRLGEHEHEMATRWPKIGARSTDQSSSSGGRKIPSMAWITLTGTLSEMAPLQPERLQHELNLITIFVSSSAQSFFKRLGGGQAGVSPLTVDHNT